MDLTKMRNMYRRAVLCEKRERERGSQREGGFSGRGAKWHKFERATRKSDWLMRWKLSLDSACRYKFKLQRHTLARTRVPSNISLSIQTCFHAENRSRFLATRMRRHVLEDGIPKRSTALFGKLAFATRCFEMVRQSSQIAPNTSLHTSLKPSATSKASRTQTFEPLSGSTMELTWYQVPFYYGQQHRARR